MALSLLETASEENIDTEVRDVATENNDEPPEKHTVGELTSWEKSVWEE